jgi:hypothetical protein
LIDENSKSRSESLSESDAESSSEFNPLEKLGRSSYLELTPEYISQNFSSEPKRHWEPPKPVLLENFEHNIGAQLKDISNLAR